MTKKKLLNKPKYFYPKKNNIANYSLGSAGSETSLPAWESSCISLHASRVCVARSFRAFLGIAKETLFFFFNLLFTFISFYDDDMESVVMTILCCSRSSRLSGEDSWWANRNLVVSSRREKKTFELWNYGNMHINKWCVTLRSPSKCFCFLRPNPFG